MKLFKYGAVMCCVEKRCSTDRLDNLKKLLFNDFYGDHKSTVPIKSFTQIMLMDQTQRF